MEPLVQEWERWDAEKWTRVLKNRWGPTVRIIQALQDSQSAAVAEDYLPALESICDTTKSSKDLCYLVRHTTPVPHSGRVSSRDEARLRQVVCKAEISAGCIDSTRLHQILRETQQGGMMLWRLWLWGRA